MTIQNDYNHFRTISCYFFFDDLKLVAYKTTELIYGSTTRFIFIEFWTVACWKGSTSLAGNLPPDENGESDNQNDSEKTWMKHF